VTIHLNIVSQQPRLFFNSCDFTLCKSAYGFLLERSLLLSYFAYKKWTAVSLLFLTTVRFMLNVTIQFSLSTVQMQVELNVMFTKIGITLASPQIKL